MLTRTGAVAAVAAILFVAPTLALGEPQSGPRFRADGRDAEAFGQREGYPACKGTAYNAQQRCRIGAFSDFARLFPARAIAPPAAASPLKRASEPHIAYTFAGQTNTLDQFLDRHPVTSLLIARGDTLLVERYQYARTDTHVFTSFSMAKTITALLVGMAVNEGLIRSIDDTADAYVSELKGTEYGRTSLKALLQMSSGVQFREVYTDSASDIAQLSRLTLLQDATGSLGAVVRFNTRVAPAGQRFSYASSETLVLGLVLSRAVGRSVAAFAEEKLWRPLGAEAEATWTVDARGQEITYAWFNARARDWIRLGLMLAHTGTWNGREIVPEAWVRAQTTVAPGDERLAIVEPPLRLGYGYQTWLVRRGEPAFALRGYRGQWLIVAPRLRLVLLQTAARAGSDPAADAELFALWDSLVATVR